MNVFRLPPSFWQQGSRTKLALIFLGSGVLVSLALGLLAARLETPTADEYAQMPAGLAYWRYGAFAIDSKNPPLAKLWATSPRALSAWLHGEPEIPEIRDLPHDMGPVLYGREFEALNQRRFAGSYLKEFFYARAMIVGLTIVLGLLVFLWARTLFEVEVAAVAAAGFMLSPTVLAHGHLATVDLGCAFTIFALCFYARRVSPDAALSRWLCLGALLGLAIATKLTALFFIPLVFLFIVWRACGGARAPGRRLVATAAIAGCGALVAVHACYGFTEVALVPLASFAFKSSSLAGKVALLPAGLARFLPALLPESFVKGFDFKLLDIESGGFRNYLLGTWSRSGFPGYYAVALAVKETLPLLLLLALAPWAVWRRARRESPVGVLFIAVPIAAILVPLSFFSDQQLGIRYILPAFPFLFLAAALSINEIYLFVGKKAGAAMIAILLTSWMLIAATAFPSFISYFNAVALSAKDETDYLADSNFDWGQDLYRLQGIAGPIGLLYWGETSPANYGINFYLPGEKRPAPGTIAISANFLQGYDYLAPSPGGDLVWVTPSKWKWLRELKPMRREGSIFIFEMPK